MSKIFSDDPQNEATQNAGTVVQASTPPEEPTVVPPSAAPPQLFASAAGVSATDATYVAPPSYDPQAVSRAAGSIPFEEGPTGTVLGAGRSGTIDTPFARFAPAGPERAAPPRYTVLKHHAKGGMGQVSVARDEELNREVALKEIQPRYAYDHAVSSRFLLEARVTGRLEHPGVVPVYGLSRHADGRPYYAMRFITGESLQDAAAAFHKADGPTRDPHERALALRGLLKRFVDVCNTIAYAHSRGILHRDLKPANVMLGAFGETLVVDWGLAKDTTAAPKRPSVETTVVIPSLAFERGTRAAGGGDAGAETRVQERPAVSLAGPAAESDGELTEIGKAMGTPAFMAPEQADGRWDDVGMLADIYSLGATLYAILCGKPPFRGETEDILARVRRGEPTPLLAQKPDTPPALAAVCRKAMALRPEDRYPTALDLAQDVERWMADEPVSVYREPFSARLLRWARRHRNLVFGLFAASLTAFVSLTVGFILVNEEQKRTVEAKQATDDANGRLAAANTNLKDEKAKVEAAQKVAVKNREEARLALLTLTDDAIGEILTSQHAATGKQEQFLRKVIDQFRRSIQEAPDEPESKLFVAGAHSRVGRLQQKLGSHREARQSYEQVFALAKNQTGPAWDQLRGETYLYSGIQYLAVGQYRPAEEHLDEAQTIFVRLIDHDFKAGRPEKPDYFHRLGQAGDRLGLALYNQGDKVLAEAWFTHSLETRRRLAKMAPEEPEYQFRVAQSLRQIAMVCSATGRRLDALEYAGDARRICAGLLKSDPTSAVYLVLLADVDGLLSIASSDDGAADARSAVPAARILRPRGAPPAAQPVVRTAAVRHAESAVANWSQLVKLYPSDVGYRQQLVVANLNLAAAEQRAGRGRPAANALAAAGLVLDDLDRLFPGDRRTAMLRGRVSHADAVQKREAGDNAAAREAAERAVRVAEELLLLAPDNPLYQNDLACYQIELAAVELQELRPGKDLVLPKKERVERLIELAWRNTLAAAGGPGMPPADPGLWANVRGFARVYADFLDVIDRLDVIPAVAKQLGQLQADPAAVRFEVACLYGRGAILALRNDVANDPKRQEFAKTFAERALAALGEIRGGFEWLPRIQADPDLAAVRAHRDYEDAVREFREPAPIPREKAP